MTPPLGWSVERARGGAAEFHAREVPVPAGRAVWIHEVDHRALVLGSAQREDLVDQTECVRRDITVVRRRSGGGAVLLVPDEVVWLDVVIPRGDPLWDDDVGRAMWWVGEAWGDALVAVGATEVAVYHGPMRPSAWSPLVCFAGLGPGEVLVRGVKAVGISQRRTRDFARFQCAIHRVWRVDMIRWLFESPRPEEPLPPVVAFGDSIDAIVEAFLAALPAAGRSTGSAR